MESNKVMYVRNAEKRRRVIKTHRCVVTTCVQWQRRVSIKRLCLPGPHHVLWCVNIACLKQNIQTTIKLNNSLSQAQKVLWIRNWSTYSEPITSHALGRLAGSRRTLHQRTDVMATTLSNSLPRSVHFCESLHLSGNTLKRLFPICISWCPLATHYPSASDSVFDISAL